MEGGEEKAGWEGEIVRRRRDGREGGRIQSSHNRRDTAALLLKPQPIVNQWDSIN